MSVPGQQGQFYQPSLVRYRAKQSSVDRTSHRHSASVMRYSGDFDMFTSVTGPGVRPGHSGHRVPGAGPGGKHINNVFRRAKSTEWDREALANNVKDLRYCYMLQLILA